MTARIIAGAFMLAVLIACAAAPAPAAAQPQTPAATASATKYAGYFQGKWQDTYIAILTLPVAGGVAKLFAATVQSPTPLHVKACEYKIPEGSSFATTNVAGGIPATVEFTTKGGFRYTLNLKASSYEGYARGQNTFGVAINNPLKLEKCGSQ